MLVYFCESFLNFSEDIPNKWKTKCTFFIYNIPHQSTVLMCNAETEIKNYINFSFSTLCKFTFH